MKNNTGKKILIVNADDYGMTRSISRGILKTAIDGIVRATTVMTNSHDFDERMDELFKECPELDIGFHANLTWGEPLSDPEEIRTLVNDEGMFLPRITLLRRSILRQISANEVYKELSSQYKKLSDRVKNITHIDGHHHIHAFPVIRDIVTKLAKEHNVQFIRAPHEGLWSSWQWAGTRRAVISALSAAKPMFWKSRGFKCADNFGGFALGAGRQIQKRWLETLIRLPEGITEIMVHPGHFSPHNDDYNIGREEEIRMLTNQSLSEAIKDCEIEISSFKNILLS